MASAESVDALAAGVTAWNRYRAGSDGLLDLSYITVKNAAIPGVDLSEVNFDGASFLNCDLSNASFSRSLINGVKFSDVLLTDSDLSDSELKGADIDHSCLCNADLSRVTAYSLRVRRSMALNIKLRDANLGQELHFYNCDMTGADITGLRIEDGLAKRLVMEPEKIKILAAAGLTDVALPNLPLAEERLNCTAFSIDVSDEEYGQIVTRRGVFWIGEGRYDVFVSYVSRYREEVVAPLVERLAARGLRVWFDDERMRLRDDNISSAIDYGVASSALGIVLVTTDFFGRKWTEYELGLLSRKAIVLLLHGVAISELNLLRPGLSEDRPVLTWAEGADRVAEKIYTAVRQEPRERSSAHSVRS
jgi:TIR domain/Pentapeptide repeats (9 copies)